MTDTPDEIKRANFVAAMRYEAVLNPLGSAAAFWDAQSDAAGNIVAMLEEEREKAIKRIDVILDDFVAALARIGENIPGASDQPAAVADERERFDDFIREGVNDLINGYVKAAELAADRGEW